MEFAEFVPPVVRNYIAALVEGSAEAPGWGAQLPPAEADLAKVTMKMHTAKGTAREAVKKEQRQAAQHVEILERSAMSLTRLGTDERMRDCFKNLKEAALTDQQLKRFISIASSAYRNYAIDRDRRKHAAELRDAVWKSATKLSKLLRELSEMVVPSFPLELYSIRHLIMQTHFPESGIDPATGQRERNSTEDAYWRSLRSRVLGREPTAPDPTAAVDPSGDVTGVVARWLTDEEAAPSADVQKVDDPGPHYIWAQSPPVFSLVDAIAAAASEFEPRDFELVEAAIKSRQTSKSQNKEYLRAFGKLLETESLDIARTRPVINAIAVAATVVLDDPDLVVTYDDVVKAIGGPVVSAPGGTEDIGEAPMTVVLQSFSDAEGDRLANIELAKYQPRGDEAKNARVKVVIRRFDDTESDGSVTEDD